VPEISQSRQLHPGVWLMLWALGTALTLSFWARPNATPIQEDEIYWIGSSYYFDLAFIHPDWRSADWQLLPARENPPVAKYAIGLGLTAAGQSIGSPDLLSCFYVLFESIPGAWGSGADFAKRAAVVSRMSPDFREKLRRTNQINLAPAILRPARAVMIICSALASLLVFLLGRRALLGWSAWLASQALLMHPVVVDSYNHAMSDAVALLFSTAAAVALLAWIEKNLSPSPRRRAGLVRSALAGLLLALACAAKMNSLVVVLLAGASVGFVATGWWTRRETNRVVSAVGLGGVILGVALIAFIALNPTIVQDVWGGLVATVSEHRQTETIQVKILQGHLATLAEKFSGVATLTAFSQIVCGVLAVYALRCLLSARTGIKFIAAWWLIAWVCVTVWIPFLRLRYAMPLVAPSILLTAIFCEEIVRLVGSAIAKDRPVEAENLPSPAT
jgi:hypothetical protein